MSNFSFKITHKDKNSRARTGVITTAHGKIETPYLIPVATRGNIIALSPKDIKLIKPQAMLTNTYHLHFKPGDKKIKSIGLRKFMSFNGPTFTDSGGFQAFSLGLGRETGARKVGFIPGKKVATKTTDKIVKINDEGVEFTSVYDNKKEFFTPKKSMEVQSNLGADIIMAFDECTSAFSSKKEIETAMHRSHKWEIESLKHYNKKQALYGIVHGGWFKDLRIESAKFINSQNFQGIAIGGSLGKNKEDMSTILSWIIPHLDDRPRHMLGIGWIDDLFNCVEQGIDTFDCVEMTRIARHKHLYVSPPEGNKKNKFTINLRESIHKNDNRKIDKNCKCYTCKNFSRSQLLKLSQNQETKHEFMRLATIHNISFTKNLCEQIRISINQNKFKQLKKKWLH